MSQGNNPVLSLCLMKRTMSVCIGVGESELPILRYPSQQWVSARNATQEPRLSAGILGKDTAIATASRDDDLCRLSL